MTRLRRALGLCILAGVVTALSVAPFGWWPLGPLGLAVLAWQLGERSWKGRIAVAAAYGLGLYGVGLAWAFEFTGGAVVFIALVAVQTAVVYALVPPGRGPGRWLGFVGATVAAEMFRSTWPFGGLPLSGIDLGQAGGPLAPIVAVGGRLLLVATVAALAAAVAAIATRQATRVGAVLVAAALVVGAAGWVVPRGHDVGRVRVAVVQGGGPRGIRAEAADEADVFRRHVAATRGIDGPVDIVLWPEDVVDVAAIAGSPEEATLRALARDLHTTLVAGVVEDAPHGRFRNTAIAYGPDGAEIDHYDKHHRVPFGEYFPFRSFLENFADIPERDAVVGPHRPGLLRTPAGPLGVLISYEVFFQGRARSAIDAGGRLLLVPTNASSYTTTQMPDQEVAAARLRAWQTGRDTIQAAPTGFSALVDARGRVLARTDLGAQDALVGTVALRTGRTPYSRTGDGPTVVAAAALVLLAWLLERQTLRFST